LSASFPEGSTCLGVGHLGDSRERREQPPPQVQHAVPLSGLALTLGFQGPLHFIFGFCRLAVRFCHL
jgi:hypothetical protein